MVPSLGRTRCSANANTTDNLSIEYDRNTALQGSEKRIRQCSHCGTTLIDDVFKDFGGLLEEHCRACLANRDICARCKSAVEPFQSHQIATRIDNGDHTTWSSHLSGVGFRGRDHALCAIEGKRSSFRRLRGGNRRC